MKKNLLIIISCVVCSVFLGATELPPLPSLDGLKLKSSSSVPLPPPMPPAPLKNTSSVSLPPAATKESEVKPIMLEVKGGDGANLKDAAKASEERSTSIDKIVTLLFDIDKASSDFSVLEKEINSAHATAEKEINVILNDLSGALGIATTKAAELAVFLKSPGLLSAIAQISGKDAQKKQTVVNESIAALQEVLKSVEPLGASLKAQQDELTKAEDTARQRIVDFKRKKSEFSENYSKASALKNDIVVQGSDGKKELSGATELLAKSKSLLEAATKESVEIKASLKNLKAVIEKIGADKKLLEGGVAKVKKELSMIGDASGLIHYFMQQNSSVVMPDVEKKLKATNATTVKASSVAAGSETSLGAENINMAYRVLGALKQGVSVAAGMCVGAYHKLVGNASEAPEITQSRGELKTASVSFAQGAVNMVSAAYSFVKNLFKFSAAPGAVSSALLIDSKDSQSSSLTNAAVVAGLPVLPELPKKALDTPKVDLPPAIKKDESLKIEKTNLDLFLPSVLPVDTAGNKSGSTSVDAAKNADKKNNSDVVKKPMDIGGLPPLPELKI